MIRPHIFLDCDGVLADFDTRALEVCGEDPRAFEDREGSQAFWARLYSHPDFFGSLPLMPGALELYAAVSHLQPSILTGCPRSHPSVREQKARWTVKHFPDAAVTMCRSQDKFRFCKPGDVLIDDWTRYQSLWEHAGGVFIHHVNAAQSLAALWRIYPELRA